MTPLQRAKLAQFEEADDPFYDDSSVDTKVKTSSTKIKEQSSTKVIANKQAAENLQIVGLICFLPRRSRQHQIRQKRQSLCQGIRS